MANRIKLIALKKCGKHKPGDKFFEQPGRAKLLIAIKSAELYQPIIDDSVLKNTLINVDTINDKEPTYLTRNLIAEQPDIEPPRRRGRPARVIQESTIEELK
jgi:hypothetical protein